MGVSYALDDFLLFVRDPVKLVNQLVDFAVGRRGFAVECRGREPARLRRLSDRLSSHRYRFVRYRLRGSKAEVATELAHQSPRFRSPTVKVQSCEKPDCSNRFESLVLANVTSPLFISEEEPSGLFLRLNESLSFAFAQFSLQQPEVGLIGGCASRKNPSLVELLQAVPKPPFPVDLPLDGSRHIDLVEEEGQLSRVWLLFDNGQVRAKQALGASGGCLLPV